MEYKNIFVLVMLLMVIMGLSGCVTTGKGGETETSEGTEETSEGTEETSEGTEETSEGTETESNECEDVAGGSCVIENPDLGFSDSQCTSLAGEGWVCSPEYGCPKHVAEDGTESTQLCCTGGTPDSDGDGLSDEFEESIWILDPDNPDVNFNGVPDGWDDWDQDGKIDLIDDDDDVEDNDDPIIDTDGDTIPDTVDPAPNNPDFPFPDLDDDGIPDILE